MIVELGGGAGVVGVNDILSYNKLEASLECEASPTPQAQPVYQL